jgi:hypothetical protein
MSTIKADTIVASDGTSPVTLTKQSAAKAWCRLDGQQAFEHRSILLVLMMMVQVDGIILHYILLVRASIRT